MFRRRPSSLARPAQIVILLPVVHRQAVQEHIEALQELGVFIVSFPNLKSWPHVIKRIYRDKELSQHVRLDIRDMAYQLDH